MTQQQCKCRTKLQLRCKRLAKTGSDFCTQHLGCVAIAANAANKANAANNNVFALKNQKNQTSGKLYRVTATLQLSQERSDERPTPRVSARELYQYLTSENGKRIADLVEDLALYQARYDTKAHALHLISNEVILSFILSVKKEPFDDMDRHYVDDNGRRRVLPMAQYIQKDLTSTAWNFGDGCYEGKENNECHYPFPDGSYSEIQVKNIQVLPQIK
jgi:hypothetical protein